MLEYSQSSLLNDNFEKGEQMEKLKRFFEPKRSRKFALQLAMSDKYKGEMTDEFFKEVDEHEGYESGVTYKYFHPEKKDSEVPVELLSRKPSSDWMAEWESKQP